MKRKYTLNDNFFQNISSEAQAYCLGLLYSDGSVCKHKNSYVIQFSQIEDRKELVYLFNSLLGSNRPIYERFQDNKYVYTCCVSSATMGQNLIQLGCTERKSLTLQFPTFISEELMSHFIRGLFDGDGCIWEGKRKKMIVKDKSRKLGFRERIVHNVKFTYTGNVMFTSDLQKYLYQKLSLSRITKLNFSKDKVRKLVCTLEYSGRRNIEKLYHYMYDNATYYDKNKFLKFKKICASVKKLTEDTSLIAGKPEMVISSQALLKEGSTTIPEMEVESSDSKCEALTR